MLNTAKRTSSWSQYMQKCGLNAKLQLSQFFPRFFIFLYELIFFTYSWIAWFYSSFLLFSIYWDDERKICFVFVISSSLRNHKRVFILLNYYSNYMITRICLSLHPQYMKPCWLYLEESLKEELGTVQARECFDLIIFSGMVLLILTVIAIMIKFAFMLLITLHLVLNKCVISQI